MRLHLRNILIIGLKWKRVQGDRILEDVHATPRSHWLHKLRFLASKALQLAFKAEGFFNIGAYLDGNLETPSSSFKYKYFLNMKGNESCALQAVLNTSHNAIVVASKRLVDLGKHEEQVTLLSAALGVMSPPFSSFTVGRELCVLQGSQAEREIPPGLVRSWTAEDRFLKTWSILALLF